jgi:hypothetical protein
MRQFLKGSAAACCLAAISVFAVAGSMLTSDSDRITAGPASGSVMAPEISVDTLPMPDATLDNRDEDHEGEFVTTTGADAAGNLSTP